MKLRSRFSFWLTVLIVVVAIIFAMPALSKSSILETIDKWFDDYTEAVEDAQNEDDDDHDDDEAIAESNMMVRIDDEIVDYIGVETLTLVETSFFPEAKALAKVVDLRPMLALRVRHSQALAALNVAKIAERAANQELIRLKSLAQGAGSVATKNISYAEATWREAKAELQGLNVNIQAVRDEAMQTWGDKVSDWILAPDSKQWQRLLSRQDSLLLVTLPIDVSMLPEVSFIRIARDGSREQARKAYFVSPALITDQLIQGETYFFKTATGKLRSGMRLDVWVPQGNEPLNGVFIPEQAIVWSSGQPWVYVQVDDDLYQRKTIQSGLTTAGGLFLEQGIDAGERLVIQGAQMLLSEEFRWQILDEDDD
ncbi:MAG: hypothetical protein DRQ46_10485 [Gammaproteobacteria bacterium]|nr:MAG: hypothetical protein DRQ46_10485 [Gammaproteobacteria bacterium]